MPTINKLTAKEKAAVVLGTVALGALCATALVMSYKTRQLTELNKTYDTMLSNPWLDDVRKYGITELK